jgi:hypothetical protein
LPAAQVTSSSVVIGLGPSEYLSDKQSAFMSLQLRSPSGDGDSVDVSGWKLARQGGPTFTFPSGERMLYAGVLPVLIAQAFQVWRRFCCLMIGDGYSSDKQRAFMSLQLRSPSGAGDSVDVSGWKLARQGDPTFTFPSGRAGAFGCRGCNAHCIVQHDVLTACLQIP